MPRVLEGDALPFIIEKMMDPYSEFKGGWINLASIIRANAMQKKELLMCALRGVIEPYKNHRKSKVADAPSYKKYEI